MNLNKIWKPTVLSLLLTFSSLVIVNCMDDATATTRYVGGGGSPNYPTITQAIAAAISGDLIIVQSGTYTENIDVSKPINIQGVNRPIIQAQNSNNPTITISAYPVVIENFQITGGSYGVFSNALTATEVSTVLIYDDWIYGNVNGIGIFNGRYHIINTCGIYQNSNTGIDISGDFHEISDSSIYQNTNGYGIISTSLSDSLIDTCSITSNGNTGVQINGNNNDILSTSIYSNTCKGLDITGNDNDINGFGLNSIHDNNGYDVYINGDTNDFIGYSVYQTNSNQGDVGIYTTNSGNSYNIIYNCVVYGYDNINCLGVDLGSEDMLEGSATSIYDNTIGLRLGFGSIIECNNPQFSSYNLKNNDINIIADKFSIIFNSYLATTGSTDNIGIQFVDESKGIFVYNCKIENMDIGIDISQSNPEDQEYPADEYNNSIYYCTISSCSIGIDINEGNYEYINGTTISNSHIGINMTDSTNVYMSRDVFKNNSYGTIGTSAGLYIYGGSSNKVDDCTFEKHYKSIWLNNETSSNIIEDTNIKDSTFSPISSEEYGSSGDEIGIFLDHSSSYQNIIDTDFDYLGYCIVMKGCHGNIFGSSGSFSCFKNTEYYDIYAFNVDTDISWGLINLCGENGKSYNLYIQGYSSENKSGFCYGCLNGTWTPSGTNYYWEHGIID